MKILVAMKDVFCMIAASYLMSWLSIEAAAGLYDKLKSEGLLDLDIKVQK